MPFRVKRCLSFVWTTTHQLRIHIRASGDKQFGDFLVTIPSRRMQRSRPHHIPHRIHIPASIQVLLDGFYVSVCGSIVN